MVSVTLAHQENHKKRLICHLPTLSAGTFSFVNCNVNRYSKYAYRV